jgi:hypothetical protein
VFGLSLDGDQAAAELFQRLPAGVDTVLAAKAAALADRLVRHVADDKLSGQVLKTRTGALKASIAAEVTAQDGVVRARVFSAGDLKYALIQEVGGVIPAHDIVPVKAKALAFLVGGRQVFAAIVHHPASTIPAHAYLSGALNDLAPSIVSELIGAVAVAIDA